MRGRETERERGGGGDVGEGREGEEAEERNH